MSGINERTLRSLRSAAVMPDQSSRMKALAARVALQQRRTAGRSIAFPDNGSYITYTQGPVYIQKLQPLAPLPPTVPDAPTGVVATPGDRQASVAFQPPARDGFSAILDYTVYAFPGGATATGLSSPIDVSGLQNGLEYIFTVRARNAIGFSSPSAASAPVIPLGLPDPPTNLVATRGNQSITVSFTPPTNTGGLPINNYIATAYKASDDSVAASVFGFNSPITIISFIPPGIVNGTEYYAKVSANTDAGSSVESAASNTVIPATTPSAPTGLTAQNITSSSFEVAFTAGSDGGSAITNYQYSTNNGSTYTSLSPADTTSPITISGLAAATAYSIKIRAINDVGIGAASATLSVTTIPSITVPEAPTNLASQNITSSSVEVVFTAGSDGGSVITNYKYSTNGGATFTALSPADTTSPITISDLSASTTYSIQLLAVNAVGDGAASASLSVTTLASDVPTGDSRMIILGDANVANVKTYINAAKTALGYGGTLTIDTRQLNGGYTTSDLSGYDVVIIFTNGGLTLNATLGDNLDAFVASGNHLIMMSYCWGNVPDITNFDYANNSVWAYKGSYSSVNTGSYTITTTHPITTGLTTTTGFGSQNIPNPITLTSGANTIATYSDGTSAIAVKTNGSSNLVGFNSYPGGSSSSNFYKFVVNSVYWVRGFLS